MITFLVHIRWQVQLSTTVDGEPGTNGLGKGTYCDGSERRHLVKNGKLGQSDGNLMTADSGFPAWR